MSAHACTSGSSGSGVAARTHSESEWRTCPSPMRGRRDLAYVDEERRRTRPTSVSGSAPPRVGDPVERALSSVAWNDATIEKMTSPSWTARTWRAENEPPSRSRSTCRITGRSTRPGRRKYPCSECGSPFGRRPSRPRRATPAPRPGRRTATVVRRAPALVLAAEQVAVELFEVEDGREVTLGSFPLGRWHAAVLLIRGW